MTWIYLKIAGISQYRPNMKKLFMLVALLLAISISPKKIQAYETPSESSAKLQSIVSAQATQSSDLRVVALEDVFKHHNSILAQYAPEYVKYADEYGIDWKLLPSIAAHESYYATYYVAGTYNVYGWGGGYTYFNSWDDGIKTVSQNLRTNYYNKGANSVWTIGPMYAGDTGWSYKVNNYMQEINNEYLQLSASSLTPTL